MSGDGVDASKLTGEVTNMIAQVPPAPPPQAVAMVPAAAAGEEAPKA